MWRRSATTRPSGWPRSARGGEGSGGVEARIGELFPVPESVADGAAGPSDDDFPPTAGYELIGILGRGRVGAVYEAVHLGLNRTVSLKMLLAGAFATRAERRVEGGSLAGAVAGTPRP